MSLDRFIDSCRRFAEFPNNLLSFRPTYPSELREYQRRLNQRAERIFCPDGHAAVEFFRYEETQNAFRSNVSASLADLRQQLPSATNQVQKDKLCSCIFVGAESSRDVLRISHHMTLWVLSFFQVLPAFLEFLFPFGRQLYPIDFQFSGFREDSRLEDAMQRAALPELRRSGQDFQICYNLKSVEYKPEIQEWPWSCRQAAIFHAFDVLNGQASWIVVKANDVIRERFKEALDSRLREDSGIYSTVSKMFVNTLACHMVIIEWCGENWRWYISTLR